MLSLSDERWKQLRHAYGDAADIPILLRQLEHHLSCPGNEEPWFSLWSALAHQGDVYSASFAAVPHIVRMIHEHPEEVSDAHFHFSLWIEICRQRKAIEVDVDLVDAYKASIGSLPDLACNALHRVLERDFLLVTLAAIAVGKGNAKLAEAITELSDDVLPEFFEWFQSR